MKPYVACASAEELSSCSAFSISASASGEGSILLENGGTVQAQNVVVGDTAGNGGDTITISGVDKGGLPSTLLVLFANGSSPVLTVAGGAGTQVEAKDGGLLAVGTSGSASIGDKFNVGKVIVHGKAGVTPATWDMLGDVFIGGEIVPSELIVTDGGRVRSTGQIIVGTNAVQDLDRVEVSGSDSFLSADILTVGLNGHGELTIKDGARVQSAAGSVGQSIGAAVGSGSVTIDGTPFTASEWHVTGNCVVGPNELGTVLLKGTTIGPFSVGGATLRVDGTLTVGAQGLINGNGTLMAASRVLNGGLISPGLSPGVIVIEGDYEQAADGLLKMEAAGLNAGQFDVLHVTGNTSLGGTLEVRFLNGYLPRTGDVIPFLKLDGIVTGDFAQITFPQLAPGFQVKREIVNGGYQLTALNNAVLAPTAIVQFSAANYNVSEGSTAVQLTVTRTGNSSDQVTVDFATSDGSAQ
jgi:T5SS/PEP-CTERM-associated repeat protein